MATAQPSDAVRRRLAESERRARDLQLRVEHETRLAGRALEETLKARQERDEYRRVLAAALANEKQALARAAEGESLEAELRQRLERALEGRASAEAHVEELELRVTRQREDAESHLRRAEERAWALSEEHGRAMQKVVGERAAALARLQELEPLVPAPTPDSHRVVRQRARFNLGVAGVLGSAAVIILPGALLALFRENGALHMGALTGLTPGDLVLLEVLLVALTLVLGSWGLHELRQAEQAAESARRALQGRSGAGTGGTEGSAA